MSKRKTSLLLIVIAILLAFLPWSCTPTDPRIQKLVDQVDSSTLLQHVQELCNIGPRFVKDDEATDKSIDYLRAELEPLGYELLEEEWAVDDFKIRNLFASKKGETNPEQVIEVSAHYDTVQNSPGADDNASGVAGLLEVARLIADQRLERTVRFCFFGGEEIGLAGSSLHVENIGEHQGEVIGLINLEMIGYATDEPGTQETPIRIPLIASPPETGNFIIVVGNFGSGFVGNIFEGAADRYVPDLEYFSVLRGCSAQRSFPVLGCGNPGDHADGHGELSEPELPPADGSAGDLERGVHGRGDEGEYGSGVGVGGALGIARTRG
ncbi:MAG: M20/M25/M40 family metallo-hydrolase [Planctomycetota bacterium]